MSDFLGNLIARAAQRAPVLERRRRAIFEPGGVRIDPWPGMGDRTVPSPERLAAQPALTGVPRERPDFAGTHVEQSSSTPVERSDVQSSRIGTFARNEHAANSMPRTLVPTEPAAAVSSIRAFTDDAAPPAFPRNRSAPAVLTAPSTRSIVTVEQPLEPSQAVLSPPATNTRHRPRVTAAVAVPSRAEAPPTDVRRPLASAATQWLSGASLPAARTTPRPESADGHSAWLKPTTPAIPQAVYVVASNRAAPRNQSTTPVASAPAVYVTIGRVEVRASAAAERVARREQPPAARMTLDDYLRKRSGSTR